MRRDRGKKGRTIKGMKRTKRRKEDELSGRKSSIRRERRKPKW